MRRRRLKAVPVNEDWVATQQKYRGHDTYQVVSRDGKRFRMREIGGGQWTSSYQLTKGVQGSRLSLYGTMEEAACQAIDAYFGSGSPQKLLIGEVARQWMETQTAKMTTVKNYDGDVRRFLKWCGEQGLVCWGDLMLSHAQRYYIYLLDFRHGEKSYSDKTIKDRLRVVKAMSLWASTNWKGIFRDFAKGVLHRKRRGVTRYDELQGAEHLTFLDVHGFVTWLWWNEPQRRFLAVGAALQGFCGMRLTEVQRLTWDRVDLSAAKITIEGEVKNESSVRRIPIPRAVCGLLASLPRDGENVIPYADRYTYSQRMSAALKRWRPGTTVVPKDLRKTIPSQSTDEGWYGFDVRNYLGHSPADITEASYIRQTKDRREVLFQEKVVSHIDKALDKADAFQHLFSSPENVISLREGQRGA